MHWIIFALVLLAYLFINVFELFPRKAVRTRANVLGAHFLAGLAVLLLVLPRLCAAPAHGQPPIIPAAAALERAGWARSPMWPCTPSC